MNTKRGREVGLCDKPYDPAPQSSMYRGRGVGVGQDVRLIEAQGRGLDTPSPLTLPKEVKRLASISFSGTQVGMTREQKRMVRNVVGELWPDSVHHGDCIGADEEFHNIVLDELPDAHIYIHPGTDAKGEMPKRAFCGGPIGRLTIYPAKPYLIRNIDLVKQSECLIATPEQEKMVTRSGTWTTVRKAKRYDKVLYVILPDGEVWDYMDEE